MGLADRHQWFSLRGCQEAVWIFAARFFGCPHLVSEVIFIVVLRFVALRAMCFGVSVATSKLMNVTIRLFVAVGSPVSQSQELGGGTFGGRVRDLR